MTDKASQANTFNRYFASVFTCDDGNIPDFPRRSKINSKFCDVSFTPLKVLRVSNSLIPKKNSHGPDGFPNILLKKLGCAICEPLPFIFQASFRSHILSVVGCMHLSHLCLNRDSPLILATTGQYHLRVSLVVYWNALLM